MQKKYDKYEDEISIFSLIWYWASRWKSIVAVALIGSILGCGFAVVKAPGTTPIGADKSEVSLELQITEDLKQFSENRMVDFQEYVDSTGILAIDAYHLYRGALTYKIEAPQESIGAIYGALYAYIYNGEMYSDLADRTGLYSSLDFAKVAGCSIFGVDAAAEATPGTVGEMTLAFTILGKTQEEAEVLLTELEHSLEAYVEQLKGSYTIVSGETVRKFISEGMSTTLADEQDKIRTKFTAEKETRNNYNSVLSSLQSQVSTGQTVETTLSKTTIMKYGAVGLVVGFVFAIFVWGLVYLFGDKLCVVESPNQKLGVKSLGTIYDTKKLNIIDRLIAQKRGGVYASLPVEEQRNVVLLNVKNELSKLDKCNKVFLVSSFGEQMPEAMLLKDGLEKAGYQVSGSSKVVGSADLLEQMSKNDAVILFEKKESSKVSLVEAEIALLNDYVDNVLGMVIVGGRK